MKDSLWSADLFRCESIVLRSYWVMVVMDLFTRRIVGFSVEPADIDDVAVCRMFNQAISGKPLPEYGPRSAVPIPSLASAFEGTRD
jgi:putative transposase